MSGDGRLGEEAVVTAEGMAKNLALIPKAVGGHERTENVGKM